MADVCSDLIAKLGTVSGVTGYVDDRLYAGKVPAGVELPFVWMQRRGIEKSGALETEDDPLFESVVIECVSDNSTEAVALSEVVRSALDGIRGLIGASAYSFVEVNNVREDYVPRNIDAEEFLHISSLDVEVARS